MESSVGEEWKAGLMESSMRESGPMAIKMD
jgi:hypothetical protein